MSGEITTSAEFSAGRIYHVLQTWSEYQYFSFSNGDNPRFILRLEKNTPKNERTIGFRIEDNNYLGWCLNVAQNGLNRLKNTTPNFELRKVINNAETKPFVSISDQENSIKVDIKGSVTAQMDFDTEDNNTLTTKAYVDSKTSNISPIGGETQTIINQQQTIINQHQSTINTLNTTVFKLQKQLLNIGTSYQTTPYISFFSYPTGIIRRIEGILVEQGQVAFSVVECNPYGQWVFYDSVSEFKLLWVSENDGASFVTTISLEAYNVQAVTCIVATESSWFVYIGNNKYLFFDNADITKANIIEKTLPTDGFTTITFPQWLRGCYCDNKIFLLYRDWYGVSINMGRSFEFTQWGTAKYTNAHLAFNRTAHEVIFIAGGEYTKFLRYNRIYGTKIEDLYIGSELFVGGLASCGDGSYHLKYNSGEQSITYFFDGNMWGRQNTINHALHIPVTKLYSNRIIYLSNSISRIFSHDMPDNMLLHYTHRNANGTITVDWVAGGYGKTYSCNPISGATIALTTSGYYAVM